MKLDALRQRLDARLTRAENLFAEFAPTVKTHCRLEQVVFLDGLLSYVWQSWGRFCRDLIFHSCVGAETASGVVLPAAVSPPTIERVSYLAVQVKNRRPAASGATNAIWRYEPTWGDIAILTKIATTLSPANSAQLVSAFGGTVRGPVHLQKVRNACAHLNDQSFAELLAIQVYYLGGPIRFPCEAAFWIDTVSSNYAFVAWLDEMRFLGARAV